MQTATVTPILRLRRFVWLGCQMLPMMFATFPGVSVAENANQSITSIDETVTPGKVASKPCIELHKSKGAFCTISINKPGNYCLMEDMHPRFDMADHPAESVMIVIRASDVVLNLQGHTLGRGRIFKNPGGVGISIHDATNIYIRNGVLQDFGTAIIRGPMYALSSNVTEAPQYDARANLYRFPITNIIVENVTFKSNEKDMLVLVKKDMTP